MVKRTSPGGRSPPGNSRRAASPSWRRFTPSAKPSSLPSAVSRSQSSRPWKKRSTISLALGRARWRSFETSRLSPTSGGMGKSCLILLDTHVVVWLAGDPGQITRKAPRCHRGRPSGRRSTGDLRCHVARTRDTGQKEQDSHRNRLCRFSRRVGMEVSCAAALPSSYPADPADRLVGATAITAGLPRIIVDRAIRQSGAACTIR